MDIWQLYEIYKTFFTAFYHTTFAHILITIQFSSAQLPALSNEFPAWLGDVGHEEEELVEEDQLFLELVSRQRGVVYEFRDDVHGLVHYSCLCFRVPRSGI